MLQTDVKTHSHESQSRLTVATRDQPLSRLTNTNIPQAHTALKSNLGFKQEKRPFAPTLFKPKKPSLCSAIMDVDAAAAAEEESIRLRKLEECVSAAMDALSRVPPEKFRQFFPENVFTAFAGPPSLDDFLAAFVQSVGRNIREETREILRERDVPALLARLDALVAAQPEFADGTSVPAPLAATPAQVLAAQAARARAAEADRLAEELHAIEEENAALRAEVITKRRAARKAVAAAEEQRGAVRRAHEAVDAVLA